MARRWSDFEEADGTDVDVVTTVAAAAGGGGGVTSPVPLAFSCEAAEEVWSLLLLFFLSAEGPNLMRFITVATFVTCTPVDKA